MILSLHGRVVVAASVGLLIGAFVAALTSAAGATPWLAAAVGVLVGLPLVVGLALCREIAEAHGGTFELSARDGGGIAVKVTVPGAEHERPTSSYEAQPGVLFKPRWTVRGATCSMHPRERSDSCS